MKKTTKKLLALCLTGVMAIGSLVGCGGGDTSADPTPTTKPADSSSNTGSTNTGNTGNTDNSGSADSSSDKKYDFGGVTVKCYADVFGNLDSEEPQYVEAKAYVEEKYNIKLEKATFEGADGGNEGDILVSSIAAGTPAAHIINLNPSTMITCYQNEILFDLTDYLDVLQVGSVYTDMGKWKGRVYGVSYENIGDTWVLAYDRDYFKQIGMEKTPTDMFMEGKWDYESCRAYLAELKTKLPDGQYPIGSYPMHWGLMASNANGVSLLTADAKLNYTDEAVIEAVTFYNDLIAEGLAYPMSRTVHDDGTVTGDYPYQINNHKDKIAIGRAEPWELDGYANSGLNFGVCFWPWGSNVTATGDYTTISDSYHTAIGYWGIDAVVKAAVEETGIPGEVLALIAQDYRYQCFPDRAVKWHDAYVQEQAGTYENLGLNAGEERFFNTEQDIELYDWGHSRAVADFGWVFEDLINVWIPFRDIFAEGKDVRATMESYYNEGIAKLQEAGFN